MKKALIALTAVAVGIGLVLVAAARPREPIRIGVLHSMTGTMAISERAVVDAVLLAVDELNASGGVLGRQVEAVIADGKSDPEVFAQEAERLIVEEDVATVFGCWTSGSRRTVKPVFEQHDHLLVYPVQYEGLERSPNILYMGAAPNQQIIPAVRWAMRNVGRRFFLVGSDYIFPRAANAIIRDHVRMWRGEIVGEEYVLLGSGDVDRVVAAIAAAQPDAILNTLNGDSNLAFFRALRAAGITSSRIPTLSFSIAENELQHLPGGVLTGDYAVWNYFQSVDTPMNRDFLRAFKARYGDDRVTSDPLEAAYVGVHLWAAAVADAGSDDPRAIRTSIADRSFRGPGGMVYVDPENQHVWKTVRIGRIRGDGQFDVQWTSGFPIQPVPYPPHRTPEQWQRLLDDMYAEWGQKWMRPAN